MKKVKPEINIFFCIILLFTVIITFYIVPEVKAIQQPNISATSAAVIDVETGQVLYNKNMNLRRPPASLTKILTAIIAIEEGNLKDIVTVSRRAVYQEGSSIYLQQGEKISLEELLYGVMLESGNDASIAVAEHISGSVEEFASLMNKRAREMGVKYSNFLNPNGLPQSGHYSSAYDLAMIMSYALKNETFARITATKSKTISSGNNWGRSLTNHNELLWSYPGVSGGKTGYTRAAGPCLQASARRNGREVVAVVLNSVSKKSKYEEIRRLLDYGLNNFKKINIVNKGDIIYKLDWKEAKEKKLILVTESPLIAVIPKGGKIKIKKELSLKTELMLPINKGEKMGSLSIYSNGHFLGKTNVLAENNLTFNSIYLQFSYWLSSYISDLKNRFFPDITSES